jgi:hypothetical protein
MNAVFPHVLFVHSCKELSCLLAVVGASLAFKREGAVAPGNSLASASVDDVLGVDTSWLHWSLRVLCSRRGVVRVSWRRRSNNSGVYAIVKLLAMLQGFLLAQLFAILLAHDRHVARHLVDVQLLRVGFRSRR